MRTSKQECNSCKSDTILFYGECPFCVLRRLKKAREPNFSQDDLFPDTIRQDARADEWARAALEKFTTVAEKTYGQDRNKWQNTLAPYLVRLLEEYLNAAR